MSRIEHVINMVDGFFQKVWSKPLTVLNKVTGKSNFDLARMFMIIGAALVIIQDIRSHSAFAAAFFVFCWVSIVFQWFFITRQVEKAVDNADENGQISLPEQPLRINRFWRLMWTVLVPIPSYDLANVGILFVIAAMYFITDFRPPCKTVFRVAFDKTKEFAQSITWSPQPIPLPIGS